MTSPALVVLLLALVCAAGTASEETADHDVTMIETSRNYSGNNIISLKMNTRTNVDIRQPNIIRYDHIYAKNHLEVFDHKLEQDDVLKRVKRNDDDPRCETFKWNEKNCRIVHPYDTSLVNVDKNYYSDVSCVTVIEAGEKQVIKLTFVDIFHIEEHADCSYDYLEIRDGSVGYAKLLGKLCGEVFPPQLSSSGSYLWLKFKSDNTIEYKGFHINVEFETTPDSYNVPTSCIHNLKGPYGEIDSSKINPECVKASTNTGYDVLWSIEAPAGWLIYLNFSSYALTKPNECEENLVQVFGYILEEQAEIVRYCGSVANSVTTKVGEGDAADKGNIMHVRLYTTKTAKSSAFSANYTAFRNLNTQKDERCDAETEFDCDDNTCISGTLRCDGYAHCRLKADEDKELCKGETESAISKPHIQVILVIFSLILSGMSFVFLFKCIKKLYEDHKIIKEHIKQSCEDRLDMLVDSRFPLDANKLQRDSEPRASLEQENHTNEMYKQQRHFSKHKPSSIDSDFIQETQLDLEDETWRRDVDRVPIEAHDIKIEKNGRPKCDSSKKEESLRNRTKESGEEVKRKEIRDVSVGAPDTKESGCQTRESLFQAEAAPSSDGSATTGSNSRGFSTFGYSGATIARPSPPPPATATSEITIELLRQVTPHQESLKSQKKIADRRPMSTETTRSAPDVIIVSKPIR